MSEFRIGCHLSSSGGFLAMGQTAESIGANVFQFFTRNPRGGKAKAVNPEDAAALVKLCQENNFAKLLAHAPYTMNPCAADEGLRDFARNVMEGDLAMLEYVPGNLYNFHPGSHVKQGVEVGIEKISAMLNEVLHKDFSVKLAEEFPNLTTSERRLATLLRLGFSSKYIATLMNISPKSVEISRYRLRQKLGLKKGDNLINFIKSI